MDTLSNNRGNAAQLGLWFVGACAAPSCAVAGRYGIYPSSRVECHLLRLLKGDVKNLSRDGKAALASLYGYIKNSDSLTLKKLWRNKNANRVFQEI